MDVGDDIVREFLVESHENLDQLDREFVALEENPHQPERLAAVFRTIHTIKGTSGFLGLHKLESLTHVAENLLSKLRDGEIVLTPDITSALLAVVDAVRDMLGHIEQTGAEGSNAYESLADRLTALRDGALAEAAAPDDAPPGQDPKEAAAPPAPPAPVEDKAPPPPKAPAAEAGHVPASVDASPTPAPPPKTTAKPGPVSSAPVADSYVRVDVGLLDRLMNLVGELVLARNQVLRIGSTVEDQAFQSTSQRLNHITSELQESVMKTRMQPVRNVWDKLPRVVRDLSVQVGKQVRVEMVGRETEIDRAILEAIKDPLTHIVRNAVDHGLESPDDRAKAGKGRTGNLRLRAFHEGGQVNIEIADDGRGLNVDAIRQKAIDRGVMSAERAARASDRELIQLVFQPAFSTAQQVTQISGRGVGMDVVKTNIEKIGGTVDLTSTRGKGTTVKIKIPLTLAIVPALIVTSGDQRFAIPQVSLLELVRLKDENARSAIEDVHGAPVFRLRGNLLPLVFLDQALGLPPPDREEDHALNIVVLQADDWQFGLVVDEVRDTEEIVVKPLGSVLGDLEVFAGATIMGDGKVALILDVLGIAARAGAHEHNEAAGDARGELVDMSAGSSQGERQNLLLFSLGANRRMAVPLHLVARLEEFAPRHVEQVGDRQVVQYRDDILPLYDLGKVLGGPAASTEGPVHALVYTQDGHSIALTVSEIIDVVDTVVNLKPPLSKHGVLGAAVIDGQVTEMLDLHGVVAECNPDFATGRAA